MQHSSSLPDPHRRNRLLAAIPDEPYAFLRPQLRLTSLTQGQLVYEANHTIGDALFPHDCIVSVTTTMADGRSAEIGTAGNEGCLGFASGLGDRRIIDQCIAQVGGTASLLPLDWLELALERYPVVRDLQMRYLKALLAHTFRSLACTSLHTVDLRCARWLLMTHDRLPGDTFPLKQDDLAHVLGVRRSTVGQICAELQKAGIIRYSRGTMTILDRARLEDAACECYGAIRLSYERLLPGTYDDGPSRPPALPSAG